MQRMRRPKRLIDQSRRYKNWPEICKVEDYDLRIHVSLVDPEEDQGAFAYYQETYPHLFSDTPVLPRVPFNALVEQAMPFVEDEDRETALQCLAHAGHPEAFGIPCQAFGLYEDLPPIPDALWEAARGKRAGDHVEYDGKSFIVIENDRRGSRVESFLAISPAEYIYLDDYNPTFREVESSEEEEPEEAAAEAAS